MMESRLTVDGCNLLVEDDGRREETVHQQIARLKAELVEAKETCLTHAQIQNALLEELATLKSELAKEKSDSDFNFREYKRLRNELIAERDELIYINRRLREENHATRERVAEVVKQLTDPIVRAKMFETAPLYLCTDHDRLTAERNVLLEALKTVWGTIEHEYYAANASYGTNHVQSRTDKARKNYEVCKAALSKVGGE